MRPFSFLLLFASLVELSLSISSDGLDLTGGPYPKDGDIVECDNAYGQGLDPQKCHDALETMPDGIQFSLFVPRKAYPGQKALETPIFYYDNKEAPSCVITVDLAGRSTKDYYVYIRKTTLRQLVVAVNNTCIIDNFGRGGFITYHLDRTILGISKYKKLPAGYNAPLFLTLQISPPSVMKTRPGNTDPRINRAVQKGLYEVIPTVTLRTSKNKIIVLINALKETLPRMSIGGTQRWWDNTHVTASIPDNVNYRCIPDLGAPNARDCEDASFNFIGEASLVVDPKNPFTSQVGNCKIVVKSERKHACTWDVLRATIDVLLNTCVDGPSAPGVGGLASTKMPPPLSAIVSTEMLSLQRRQDSVNNTAEDVGAPPLPPNFVIEIGWARPLPPGPPVDPVCSENTDNANNTDGCVVASANASVLIGNGTDAGLLPVTIDSFSDS